MNGDQPPMEKTYFRVEAEDRRHLEEVLARRLDYPAVKTESDIYRAGLQLYFADLYRRFPDASNPEYKPRWTLRAQARRWEKQEETIHEFEEMLRIFRFNGDTPSIRVMVNTVLEYKNSEGGILSKPHRDALQKVLDGVMEHLKLSNGDG